MVALALRRRLADAFSGLFWLSAVCAALMPTSIGYQDLAAFFARQPGVSQRWRDHLIASPFGTIHAATFSFSRPIGTAMPEPTGAQPVNFDPRAFDVKTWPGDELLMARPAREVEYPTVNRRLKGDRMPLPQSSPDPSGPESLPSLQPVNAPSSPPASSPPITVRRPKSAEQLDPARSDGAVEVGGSSLSRPHAEEMTSSVRSDAVDESDGEGDANTADESVVADTSPGIPAAGGSDLLEAPAASFSLLDDGAASRSATADLFRCRGDGFARRTATMGARCGTRSGVTCRRSRRSNSRRSERRSKQVLAGNRGGQRQCQQVRSARRLVSVSPANRARRRRSASPTRFISRRGANRCADRWRWRRW